MKLLLVVCFFCILGCARAPSAAEGQRRLVGAYRLDDRRQPIHGLNTFIKSATLLLRVDGTAVQVCEYKDGTKYESSGMAWSYEGDGNVHLSPFKDCSWVWGDLLEAREGPLERPRHGASLIVQWSKPPLIVIDPDLPAFYVRQEASR